MRNFCVLLLFFAMTCTVHGDVTPDVQPYGLLVRHPRQLDLLGGTRRVIEQLVENLRLAATEATEMIAKFTSAVQNEALQIEQRIVNDIERLRERVAEAVDNVTNRLIDSGVAVIDCIASHREDATAVFDETMTKAMSCVESRLSEIREQMKGLGELAGEAISFANSSISDMRKCTEENEGYFINTGTCLGKIALQTEAKALAYGTQMTVAIGQINLSLATLPVSLEVCAGSRLVESSVTTARIIMEIGTCSASSIFSTLVGPYPYTSTVEPLSNEPDVVTEASTLK